MKCRAYLQYDGDQVSNETGVDCSKEKLKKDIEMGLVPEQDVLEAHQEYKDECDINKIVEKIDKTGLVPNVNQVKAAFGDFSGPNDYQQKVIAINQAREAFMELPAKIRNRFDNDPAKLLEFLTDDKNTKEAQELGLVDYPAPGSSTPDSRSSQEALSGLEEDSAESDPVPAAVPAKKIAKK